MVSTGRVNEACARCRKQKLKCDAQKPCTLCVRTGVRCQPRRTSLRANGNERAFQTPTRYQDAAVTVPAAPSNAYLVTSPSIATATSGASRSPDGQPSPARRAAGGRQYSYESPRGDVPKDTDQSPQGHQQFGANSSVIGFARNVFRHNDLASHNINSTILGDAGGSSQLLDATWGLQSMPMPPAPVMLQLLYAYFDRVHWLIFLFHKPSFLARAEALLAAPSWTRQDLPDIMTLLVSAAMGLKCVLHDPSWAGRATLDAAGLDARSLLANFIVELRLHLVDLLDDSQVQTVQVCLLLGTYYVYHGSPSLAWSILGMAVRTAYALAMHCEDPGNERDIAVQVRHRCWNHVTTGDTFASLIYGRPASLDPAFAQWQPLCEMDDTQLGLLPNHGGARFESSVLVFHALRCRLYAITRQILSGFRLLRLKDPLSLEDQNALADAVFQAESQVAEWKRAVPTYLLGELWQNASPSGPFPPELSEMSLVGEELARIFMLQAIVLQLGYDSTLLLIHRPFLEHKMEPSNRDNATVDAEDHASRSLEVAVGAALRISRAPMLQMNHHLSLSFAFMHFFTAGVILCVPPARQPFSDIAQESKAGIMRIIRVCRSLGSSSRIGTHIDQLLTALLRVTVLREMDNALQHQTVAPPLTRVSSTFNNVSRSDDFDTARPSAVNPQLPETENLTHDPLTTTASEPANLSADQPASHLDAQFNFDMAPFSENGGFELHTQMDEAFGSFGQIMFNIVPDDPYTPWNWGPRLR